MNQDGFGEIGLYNINTDAEVYGPAVGCLANCVGTGTAGAGGPQSAVNDDNVGYRIVGNTMEMYISYSQLGVTGATDLCLLFAVEGSDSQANLNQASSCDSTINSTGSYVNGVLCIVAPTATPTPTSTSTSTSTPTDTPTPTATATCDEYADRDGHQHPDSNTDRHRDGYHHPDRDTDEHADRHAH